MSITTAQIRGARGVLNWSQSDLAKRTNISATSIGSIENGLSTPRESTLNAIKRAFENGGVEFIGAEGIRMKTGNVRTFQGKDGFINFYNEVYQTLLATQKNERQALVSNVDERPFVKWLGEFKEEHIQRMLSLEGLKFRILIKENDEYTPAAAYAEYRNMPSDLFYSVPFYVYGKKLAIMLFEPEPTIIRIDYPAVTEAYKVQFEDMWARSTSLSKDELEGKVTA